MLSTSCSGTKGVNASNSTSAVKGKNRDKQIIALGEGEGYNALEEKFAFDTRSLKKDKKGNFMGPVRSQYEGRKNVSFGGGIGTAGYKTSPYHAPKWNGKQQADIKNFGGNLDGSRFQVPSRFQGTSPAHLAQTSRYQGRNAPTNSYRVESANENRANPIGKPTDGWTDFRRRVFPEPDVMSKAQYDKLNVEQARNVLGRDD